AIPDTWVSTSLLTIPSTKSVQNMCWCTNFFSFLRDLNPKKDVSKVVNQDSMALCSRLRDSKEHVGKLLAATRTARIVSTKANYNSTARIVFTKANYNSWMLIFRCFLGRPYPISGFLPASLQAFQQKCLHKHGIPLHKICARVQIYISPRLTHYFSLRDLNPKKDVSKVVNQDSMALCSRLRDSKKRVGKLLAATRTAHIVSTKANYNSLIPPILAANVIGILSVAETAVHDISMSASNFARA
ncbi:hypothetical protein RRG08_006457, partial [Elysia crispata]